MLRRLLLVEHPQGNDNWDSGQDHPSQRPCKATAGHSLGHHHLVHLWCTTVSQHREVDLSGAELHTSPLNERMSGHTDGRTFPSKPTSPGPQRQLQVPVIISTQTPPRCFQLITSQIQLLNHQPPGPANCSFGTLKFQLYL